MEEKKQKLYELGWAMIPPPILGRTDLIPNEKILWGRINGLIENKGYCYASNDWLGRQLGLDKDTISNLISSLEKKGTLRRVIVRDKSNQIIRRKLYPLSIGNRIPIRQTMGRGIRQPVEAVISNRDNRNREEKGFKKITWTDKAERARIDRANPDIIDQTKNKLKKEGVI